MENKQFIIGILAVLALALLVISLSYSSLTGFSAKEETLKIGSILPLSGQMSFVGTEVRNGISLAVEDINSANKRKIEVIFEDSKMDPKEGISAINKLIDFDKVNYVHVFGTSIINAVQPVTESKKVILAGVSISPKILEDKNYTLRLHYNLDQASEKLTDFIDQRKFSDIVVLSQKGEAWEREVMKLENAGINFIRKESFDQGEKDFRTSLLKIKSSNPDLLIIFGYGANFPVLFQQIEELDMKNVAILGGLDFLEVPKESLYLYNNVVFVAPSFNVEPNKNAKAFIKRYENKFKNKPTHQAAYAYDTINLLYLSAINSDGDIKKSMIYLKSLKSYSGVSGKIEILPNGDTKSSLSLATYKNGNLVQYKE